MSIDGFHIDNECLTLCLCILKPLTGFKTVNVQIKHASVSATFQTRCIMQSVSGFKIKELHWLVISL